MDLKWEWDIILIELQIKAYTISYNSFKEDLIKTCTTRCLIWEAKESCKMYLIIQDVRIMVQIGLEVLAMVLLWEVSTEIHNQW